MKLPYHLAILAFLAAIHAENYVEYEVEYVEIETFEDSTDETGDDESTSASAIISTAPPTSPPTTPPTEQPGPYPPPSLPNLDNADLLLGFNNTFEDYVFSEDLNDEETELYKRMEKNVSDIMEGIFGDLEGFKGVRVNGFYNGSVVADVDIIYGLQYALSNPQQMCEQFYNTTRQQLGLPPSELQNCSDEIERTNENICDQASVVCPVGNVCHDVMCYDPCTYYVTEDLECTGEGEVCTTNAMLEPICSCSRDYLNVGDDCIHQNNIIAISASVGGFLLIVISVISTLFCCHVNRNNKLKETEQDLWPQYPSVPNAYGDVYLGPETYDDVLPLATVNRSTSRHSDAASRATGTHASRHSERPELGSKQGSKQGTSKDSDQDSGHDNPAFIEDDQNGAVESTSLKGGYSQPSYEALDPDPIYAKLLSSDKYKNFSAKVDHIDPEIDYSIKRPQLGLLRVGTISSGSSLVRSEGEEMEL